MKKTSLLFITSVSLFFAHSQDWKIASAKILTPWAEQVNASSPLPEYPRPEMVRSNNWTNINGLWQYAILPKEQVTIPSVFPGKILVPFAVESALSGVAKTVGKDSVLWYQRSIAFTNNKDRQTLLHFGAVDWLCDVFVNGKKVGTHQGGYDPFSFDITTALKKGSRQEIVVRVWDPSDDGPQPRGKQVKKPASIWYTPVTGIWQTVWIETVSKTYIAATKQTPDIDKKIL